METPKRVQRLRASDEWRYLKALIPEFSPETASQTSLSPADTLETVLLRLSDEDFAAQQRPIGVDQHGAVHTGDPIVDEGERKLAEKLLKNKEEDPDELTEEATPYGG